MSTFTEGQRVYLIDGTECEYVGAVADKHAVRKMYEDDDGEPCLGDSTLVREVFAAAPTAKLDAEVARLQRALDAVRASLAAAQAEERQLAATRKERETLLAQDQATARIVDFIAGKITHFVVIGYEGPLVLDTASAINYHEDIFGHRVWNGETKLLTLYGASDRHGKHRNGRGLSWRLSHYSDGSGHSTEVIPCMSEEEARAVAKARLDAWLAGDPRGWDRAAKAAAKLGFEVPAAVAEHLRAEALNRAREALAQREAAAAEARAALAALESSQPAVQP